MAISNAYLIPRTVMANKQNDTRIQKAAILSKLKGTATLVISIFYVNELSEPWSLIPVSSKSVEKCGSYGRLNIFIFKFLHANVQSIVKAQYQIAPSKHVVGVDRPVYALS